MQHGFLTEAAKQKQRRKEADKRFAGWNLLQSNHHPRPRGGHACTTTARHEDSLPTSSIAACRRERALLTCYNSFVKGLRQRTKSRPFRSPRINLEYSDEPETRNLVPPPHNQAGHLGMPN